MLEIVGLSKHFGELKAVDGLSLTLEKGKISGLIGPNGSGKTTAFNLVTGFLQPTKGKIIWQGENIAGKPPHVIARKGIVRTFQLTRVLAGLTALENVVMGCHLQTGMSPFAGILGLRKSVRKERTVEEKAMHLLEFMGMAKEKDRIAGKLPGGTQKVLAMTIALAANPKLLMLDEPVAGLNTSEKAMVMDKIKVLREQGITIFIVEHDMKAIMSTCDMITVINFGVRIAHGSPEEVISDPQTIKAYLGKGDYGLA